MASSGNFATWNPLTIGSRASLADGNLTMKGTSVDVVGVTSTIGITTGKWYWEIYIARGYNANMHAGINSGYEGGGFYSGYAHLNGMTPSAIRIRNDGTLQDNSSSDDPDRWGTITLDSTNVQTFDDTDILMFALDYDNKKLWIGKNGTFMNSGNPAGGSNQQASWTGDVPIIYPSAEPYYTNNNETANFGQDSSFSNNKTSGSANASDSNGFGDFYYTPPTDYLALTSANLPISSDIDPAGEDGADDNPTKQFNTILYTGIGGTSANNVSGVGYSPDLIWIKNREQSAAYSNCLVDSSRGRSKVLYSSRSDAEATSATNRDISSINSDGFTIQDTSNIDGNQSGIGYVAWCWKANGGTTSTNSEGDANTTVQANTKAGFSIVEFPNYSGDTKFGHGLTKAPNFIIAKLTASGSNWPTYHDGYSSGKCCFLNLSNAEATSSHFAHSGAGNPVSATTFGLGASFAGSGAGIAYCWHSVEGYSRFSSYEGNGNADGAFVYTGGRPSLIAIKRTDSSGSWHVFDSARNTHNAVNTYILWDSSSADDTASSNAIDFLSNGFKIRNSASGLNASGGNYIYMCWNSVPFKYNNTF